MATALEAAYRIAGVEVEELAWEELYDMVDENNPRRTTAALRVLKYHGIHKRVDYKKVNSLLHSISLAFAFHFCFLKLDATNQIACLLHSEFQNVVVIMIAEN